MNSMTLFPVPHFPLVQPGDDVATLIVERLTAAGESLQAGDILVMAQKIVSKAEGRLVRLGDVVPDEEALRVADLTKKDPRIVKVVLDDSRAIIRALPGLFITEQTAGWICVNSGMDRSNVAPKTDDEEIVALLPLNGDASAEKIRTRLADVMGVPLDETPAIIINDTHGRPWRIGNVGVCIGCAGLAPIWDQRGLPDLFGYTLEHSEECIADELAAAASLLMGQSNEGTPVVVVRGYRMPAGATVAPARSIQRDPARDAFR